VDVMQKIKILLVALTMMVIAATFFQSIATAAQVTRINENKGYIFIDGSIADGFVMGAKVCFYSSSDEEITCGRVEQASESFARVKVNNRIAKKIRYGMEAKLSDEKANKTEKTGPQACSDDSDCGSTGYCVNGKCQQ
jgi:hypothetical protein